MSKPLIQINNVTTGYSGRPVLHDVSFYIEPNDFTGIIGPNGGGKTTLLLLILGLLKPDSGTINRNIGKHDIGYLPQVNQLDHQFPIKVSNVILSGLSTGLNFKRKRNSDSMKKVEEILESIGISDLKNRPIGELSGGELQRTMLARAIISSPKLLILDEPNTYVDNRFEHELYRILSDLNKKMAILLVSHDVGTITPYIKSIACVNGNLHFHPSNEISTEQLKVYNCPIELVTHGPVPHRVMENHKHN
ncbi:MAG: ATP-binding cassette domain-containing protein [Bacteroidales bacterium]|jgi:zinc transport system ATP-binding protein|nr:ATP-binding cassette domain-containing protein [Bacteroidales bacterium]